MIEAIFKYEFIQNAFLIGIIIGLLSPIIGSFVLIRKLSFITDTLSHVTLAGIAFALFINSIFDLELSILLMSILFSIIGAVLIDKLRNYFSNYKEVALPIVMSGGVALSVIFINLSKTGTINIMNYLFGSINSVSRGEVLSTFIISIIVIITIIVFKNKLIAMSFDEAYSRLLGFNSNIVQMVFTIILATVIAVAIKIVGVLLVSALMIIPVTAAMKVGNNFKQTVIFGIIFSEISVIGGLIASFYLNIPSGAMIVLLNILILLLVFGYNRLPSANTGGS